MFTLLLLRWKARNRHIVIMDVYGFHQTLFFANENTGSTARACLRHIVWSLCSLWIANRARP